MRLFLIKTVIVKVVSRYGKKFSISSRLTLPVGKSPPWAGKMVTSQTSVLPARLISLTSHKKYVSLRMAGHGCEYQMLTKIVAKILMTLMMDGA